jgi:hypothetical protein
MKDSRDNKAVGLDSKAPPTCTVFVHTVFWSIPPSEYEKLDYIYVDTFIDMNCRLKKWLDTIYNLIFSLLTLQVSVLWQA